MLDFIKRYNSACIILHHPIVPNIFTVICFLILIIMTNVIAINYFKNQLIMLILWYIEFRLDICFPDRLHLLL